MQDKRIYKRYYAEHLKIKNQETIQNFKEKYQQVNDIFIKYKIFKNRLSTKKIFLEEDKRYWNWYVTEIEIAAASLKKQETYFIKQHFLYRKDREEMFISNSKYYLLMKDVCNNFLYYLDTTFHALNKRDTQYNVFF